MVPGLTSGKYEGVSGEARRARANANRLRRPTRWRCDLRYRAKEAEVRAATPEGREQARVTFGGRHAGGAIYAVGPRRPRRERRGSCELPARGPVRSMGIDGRANHLRGPTRRPKFQRRRCMEARRARANANRLQRPTRWRCVPHHRRKEGRPHLRLLPQARERKISCCRRWPSTPGKRPARCRGRRGRGSAQSGRSGRANAAHPPEAASRHSCDAGWRPGSCTRRRPARARSR